MTAEAFLLIGRAAHRRRGPNFHYTTPPVICQAKFAEKLHKNFFLKLCKILLDNGAPMCYTVYRVKGEPPRGRAKKFQKFFKNPLTDTAGCAIMSTTKERKRGTQNDYQHRTVRQHD